jgi:two-component system, cell cycle sensor histidine kinase and response regulator CckA
MKTDERREGGFFSSPLRLAGVMIAAIFFADLIIMLLLTAVFPETPAPVMAVLDAVVLTLVIIPVFWRLVVRPLKKAALREKARAEEMSAQSAHDWEDTFNTITDMITVHDKDFTIIRANRAARELLHLPEDGMGTAKCFQHFHGTDCPPTDCPSCRSIALSQPVAAESFEPHLNRYIETRAIPRFNSDNEMVGLIHVVRDITKRKHMEALLENQKAFAENLVQNSAVATFVLDPQHKVVLWNKACEELTGIPARDMIGTDSHWMPFYDEKRPTLADIVIDSAYDDLSTLYTRYSRSSLVSNGVHAEGWYLNINGKNRYILFDAAPIYSSEGDLLVVIETLQDVPERKRIEEDLARSEGKLRTLIDAEQDCVKLLAADGTLLEINPAGLKMIDADSLEQVTGKSIYPLVVPAYLASVQDLTRTVFQGGSGNLEFEFVGLKGTRRWVETRAVPLKSAAGEVIALLGVTRDISEHKKLEEQLRHAQKLEAVGTLTGGIAHDFNNILTSIIGYTDLLSMTIAENEQTHGFLDQIIAASRRAANLTQNLLAFSRKQITSPRPVNINECIRTVENMLHRLIGEEIELRTRLSDADLTILADAGQMEQILMNLAVNARDAMPGGGTLLITTTVAEIDDEFISLNGYGKAGTYVLVTIKDSGIGMDARTKRRIFEPFFTTKDTGKGTGLGLSIVYGIVKQHNGYIDCESEPGKGTTFTIYFPLKTTSTEQALPALPAQLKGGTETVLVTDDDEAVRRITRTMLEHLGYTVIMAVDGKDAVEVFEHHKDRVDLLILDVIMPKKNGKQVYDEVRRIRPGVKTIFTSGYTADVISSKGMLEEGMHFITKPASLRELSHKIRDVLDAP